jgi:hypothetical protein
MAYYFYLDGVLLPVTPAKLSTKIKNKNKTVDLINESEINILKDAGLTEVSFEALLPNVQYPFSVYLNGFQKASYYLNKLESLKVKKKPFQFIVTRKLPSGGKLSYTNLKVSLESYDINETVNDGFDISVSISLKQYKSYGAKSATIRNTTVKKDSSRDSKDAGGYSYTIQSGDTLWGISKKEYGTGTEHKTLYNANKTVIENAAKDHGKQSSSNGWWIYPGTDISIPKGGSTTHVSNSGTTHGGSSGSIGNTHGGSSGSIGNTHGGSSGGF